MNDSYSNDNVNNDINNNKNNYSSDDYVVMNSNDGENIHFFILLL